MCVIVDNNVRGLVFGKPDEQTPAGKYLLDWLNGPHGKLVVGGELRRELGGYRRFEVWLKTAVKFGRARQIDDTQVDNETDDLKSQNICGSDDEHVLALARISGARLLATNDGPLERDFKDHRIIYNPRGKIYPDEGYRGFLSNRNNRSLCGVCGNR